MKTWKGRSRKTQEVKRDMEDVRKVHLKMVLKTQDGSTVLTYTQFTYNISFTHTKKNP